MLFVLVPGLQPWNALPGGSNLLYQSPESREAGASERGEQLIIHLRHLLLNPRHNATS